MKEHETITKESKLSNMTDIEAYIKKIQQPFLTSLQSLCEAKRDKIGWDYIDSNGEFVSIGNHVSLTDTEVFTGRRVCVIAAAAIYRSLKKVVSQDISVDVVHTHIYFDKKYVRMNSEPKIYGDHFLVTTHNLNTKEEIGIDPTYAQVNAAFAGKFLIFNVPEIGNYYSSSKEKNSNLVRLYYDEHPLDKSELKVVTYRINDHLQFVLNDFQLSQSGYDALVTSGGGI